MMARAHPNPGLRPYLPADAPLLAEIFRASIAKLAADDYSAAQQDAWAAFADDEAFGKMLSDNLTLVAMLDGSPVLGSLPSFSTTPISTSSSRMRSASLKFFAARAALREAIWASTFCLNSFSRSAISALVLFPTNITPASFS